MAYFKKFQFRVFVLAALSAGVTLSAVPANAGFEWTPPPKPVAPAAPVTGKLPDMPPAMPSLSPDKVESSVLTPMPNFGGPAMAGKTSINPTPLSPSPLSPLSVASAPAVPTTTPLSSSGFPDAVGFGNDLPLALALHQIVPAQYAYVFDNGVDQSAKLNWNGGKAWNLVLDDALKPLGYGAAIEGQTVRITAQPNVAAPVAQPVQIAHAATPSANPAHEVYIPRTVKPVAGRIDTPPTPVAPAASHVPSPPEPESAPMALTGPDEEMSAPPAKPVMLTRDVGEVSPVPEIHVQAPEPVAYASKAPMLTTAEPEQSVYNNSTSRIWDAKTGDSLRMVLQQWSEQSGVQFYWSPAAKDFILTKPVHLQGSYTDAVSNILDTYDEDRIRPVARLHPNLPTGPAVLVVETTGFE